MLCSERPLRPLSHLGQSISGRQSDELHFCVQCRSSHCAEKEAHLHDGSRGHAGAGAHAVLVVVDCLIAYRKILRPDDAQNSYQLMGTLPWYAASRSACMLHTRAVLGTRTGCSQNGHKSRSARAGVKEFRERDVRLQLQLCVPGPDIGVAPACDRSLCHVTRDLCGPI